MYRNFIFILISIFLFSYYFYAPDFNHASTVAFIISLTILILFLFVTKKEKITFLRGHYLKHSTLVILGFVIVHFQYHVDFLLGNIDAVDSYIWVDNKVVIKGLVLSSLGLVLFFLGYFSYKENSFLLFNKSYYQKKNLYSVKVLVWISAFVLIAYFYTVNPLYLAGMYGAEKMGAEASYFILLFKVIVFAIFIQNSRNLISQRLINLSFFKFCKYHGFLFNFLVFVYLSSVIFSGDRGPLIFFGIAYFSSYIFVTKYKFSFLNFSFILIGGILFISLLGVVRNFDRTLNFFDRLNMSFTAETRFSTNSFLPHTQELATSLRTLHHTLSYIPDQHDFLFGRFQFQQLMSIIPFGSNFVHLIFDDNSYKYSGSARFITWINQGSNPISGDGTSVIADFYFDFGIVGVMFGMFIFGYTMRFAEFKMYSSSLPSYFSHAFFIGYLCSAIYISRSTFLIELKTVFWVFIILLVNKYILNYKIK